MVTTELRESEHAPVVENITIVSNNYSFSCLQSFSHISCYTICFQIHTHSKHRDTTHNIIIQLMIQHQQLTLKQRQHLFSTPVVLLWCLCSSVISNHTIFLLAAIVPALPITHTTKLPNSHWFAQPTAYMRACVCVCVCVCLHVFLCFSSAIIQSLSIIASMRVKQHK